MQVFFFGALAEITGNTLVDFKTCETTDALREEIVNRFPALKDKRFKFAVNHELVTQNEKIMEGDELALLAPFSGG